MEIPIVAALAGAVAGGVFSLLNQILLDRRKRREEARLRHLQRQIEELYGPLYGLIQFGAAINEAEWLRLPKESRDENGWPRDEQGGKALQFFRERYYLPLNEQMLELIRTRIHLLDSDGIPESFAKFTRHAAQLDCFHRLYSEVAVRTHGITTIDYPPEFRSDVEDTLYKLRKEYDEYIRRLEGGRQIERWKQT
jgi:hypothetical protein